MAEDERARPPARACPLSELRQAAASEADLTTAREARTTYDNRGYARDGAETSWKGPAFVFH